MGDFPVGIGQEQPHGQLARSTDRLWLVGVALPCVSRAAAR